MKSNESDYIRFPLESVLINLQNEGFVLGVDELCDFQKIILAFGSDYLDQPENLKNLLAPTVCKNSAEQEKFYQIFDDAIALIRANSILYLERTESEIHTLSSSSPHRNRRRFYQILLISGALLTLLAFYLFITISAPKSIPEKKAPAQDTAITEIISDAICTDKPIIGFDIAYVDSAKQIIFFNDQPLRNFTQGPIETDTFRELNFLPIHWNNSEITSRLYIDTLQQLVLINSNPRLLGPDSVQFTWNFGNGDIKQSNDTILYYRYAKLGTYHISLTGTLPSGCDSTVTQSITLQTNGLRQRKALASLIAIWDQSRPEKTSTKNHALGILLLAFGLVWIFGEVVYFAWKRLSLSDDPVALKRRFTAGDYPPYQVPFSAQDLHIRPPSDLYSVAESFRQRSISDIKRINIRKSIYASVRSGGLTRIKYNQLSKPSEYLIWVDEQTTNNQQARFFDYLISSIEREDVFIEKFYYRQDFRHCWNRMYPEGLPLENLYNKHPNHRLVLFTNGQYLVDPTTGKVRNWAKEALLQWNERVLLTPTPVENWGLLEFALNEIIPVLPASLQAQQLIVDTMTGMEPSLLSKTIERFQDIRFKSSNLDLSNPEQLQAFLGEPTFLWFCCLALYNKLQWEISLAIGKRLQEEYQPFVDQQVHLLQYEHLAKLTRIDCMRTGVMSADLRARLLTEIEKYPELEVLARRAILDLLGSANLKQDAFAFREQQIELAVNNTLVNNLKDEKRAVFFLWNAKLLDRLQFKKFNPLFKYKWRKTLFRLTLGVLASLLFYFSTNKLDSNNPIIQKTNIDKALQRLNLYDYLLADSSILFHNVGVELINIDSIRQGENWLDIALKYRLPETYPLASKNQVIAKYLLAKHFFDMGENNPVAFIALQKQLEPTDSIQAYLANAIGLCYLFQDDSIRTREISQLLKSDFPWFLESVHPNLLDALNLKSQSISTVLEADSIALDLNDGVVQENAPQIIVGDSSQTSSRSTAPSATNPSRIPVLSREKSKTLFPEYKDIARLDTLVIQFPNLLFLNARMCTNLKNIDALTRLPSLQSLNLSYTSINSIEALRGLYALYWLNLKSTQITDLSPLANLTRLKSLDISNNPNLKSLNGVKNLDLEILDATMTGIPKDELETYYKAHPKCKRKFDL